MSKRLQVLVDERELRQIQHIARKNRMTVAEWVRQALRASARHEPSGDPRRKIETIRAAVHNTFPTADIEQMLAEIERGYLAGPA